MPRSWTEVLTLRVEARADTTAEHRHDHLSLTGILVCKEMLASECAEGEEGYKIPSVQQAESQAGARTFKGNLLVLCVEVSGPRKAYSG
jgi:hypothetical protein